jgi:hypothetical protein
MATTSSRKSTLPSPWLSSARLRGKRDEWSSLWAESKAALTIGPVVSDDRKRLKNGPRPSFKLIVAT